MGAGGARCPAPDVANRGGASAREGREVAIVVEVRLDRDSPNAARKRYALETLLGAIGVPYELRGHGSGDGGRPEATGRQPSVVLGPEDLASLPGWDALAPGEGEATRERASPSRTAASDSIRSPQSSALDVIFRLLARSEEGETKQRDKYGRFLWAHTAVLPAEDAARPLVSECARALLAMLEERADQAGAPFIRKEPWPGGRPMAACLTHDVDSVRRGKLPGGVAMRDLRAAAASAAAGRFGLAARQIAAVARTTAGPNPYWTFDRISALERGHGFRSTYFVMAGRLHPEDSRYDPAREPVRSLIRSLAASGCEIALHGSFGPYADPVALRRQKALLEDALGAPVSGHRNHVLRFDLPESWRAQEATGFSYDGTLGFADHEGFRGCHAFPFRPYDAGADRPLDLIEIPLAVMDVTLHKYRGLRGEAAVAAARRVLEQTLAVGGLATLLWHNDTFYDPEYPGCGTVYEAALEWLDEHGAWVATCAEVDRWWRAREAVRIAPSPEGRGWVVRAGREIDGLVLRVSAAGLETPPEVLGERAEVGREGRHYTLRFGRLRAGADVRIA